MALGEEKPGAMAAVRGGGAFCPVCGVLPWEKLPACDDSMVVLFV